MQQQMTETASRDHPLSERLDRIADALERLAPPSPPEPDFTQADGFVWQPEPGIFQPVPKINRIPLPLLKGIDRAAGQQTLAVAHALVGIDQEAPHRLSATFTVSIGFAR